LFNHSCDPNCGFLDGIKLVAIRDINPNEELVIEYVTTESSFESFDCNCGSDNCRKVITATDWENPKLQERLGEYFAPYLKKRFS